MQLKPKFLLFILLNHWGIIQIQLLLLRSVMVSAGAAKKTEWGLSPCHVFMQHFATITHEQERKRLKRDLLVTAVNGIPPIVH